MEKYGPGRHFTVDRLVQQRARFGIAQYFFVDGLSSANHSVRSSRRTESGSFVEVLLLQVFEGENSETQS